MDMRIVTIIFFDGVSYAATLFLLSLGLTVVFGVLRILNISHGGIYALGAYLGTWLSLWLLDMELPPALTYIALFVGALIVGFSVGPVIERLLLRRIRPFYGYGRVQEGEYALGRGHGHHALVVERGQLPQGPEYFAPEHQHDQQSA